MLLLNKIKLISANEFLLFTYYTLKKQKLILLVLNLCMQYLERNVNTNHHYIPLVIALEYMEVR